MTRTRSIRNRSLALMLAAAGGTAGTVGAAAAEQPATSAGPMETLVVTGTRLESEANALAGHVTVIDRAALEARQPRSVLDVLRSVAGIQVSQNGGRGGVSSVFLRGAEPNFTVVLIDGVQVNDPNNTRGGSFDFATIDLAEVERIEIVRGAYSSVYGSDALAGIINIITREAADTRQAAVGAELGEDRYRRGSMHVSGPLTDTTGASLTATASDDGDAIEGNHYQNRTVAVRVESRPADGLAIDVSGRWVDAEARAFPEDSGGPELAVLRDVDRRDQTQSSGAGRLRYRLSDRLTVNVQAGFVHHEEQAASPGIAAGARDGVPPTRSESELERLTTGIDLAAAVTDTVQMAVGVDYEEERGELDGSVELFPGFELPTDFTLERDTVGVFGELRWEPGAAFSLSGSVRHDEPDETGGETTGRLGAQYRSGATRLFASWSEGYKLPSFFALGHALVGNPDLRPETSTSWELGVGRSMLEDRLEISVTGFRSEYRNLIDFDFELFRNVNRREVEIDGAELAAAWTPTAAFHVDAHVSWVNIDVVDSPIELRQRPEWRGGLSAAWAIGASTSLCGSWLYVGETFDSSVPTGGLTLDGYDRLDLELAWRPTSRLRLWLAVDNALGEDYQEAIGFPALGTRWRVGGRYSL